MGDFAANLRLEAWLWEDVVRRVGAWESLKDTPLANQVEWLQYVDEGVSLQGLKHIQAAVSARVIEAIPSTTLYQNTDDLDALYDAALIAKNELRSITNSVADNTNGVAGFRPDEINNGLKSRARAEEKIAADYAGDASRLVDIAGSKIVYETLDDLYLALDNTFGNYQILKIKDRIKNPLPSGYRDILMNLQMSNGHIVEFRLHLKEIDEIADGIGHELYEQVRSIEAIIETEQGGVATAQQIGEIQQFNQQMEQLYNDAYQVILSRQ